MFFATLALAASLQFPAAPMRAVPLIPVAESMLNALELSGVLSVYGPNGVVDASRSDFVAPSRGFMGSVFLATPGLLEGPSLALELDAPVIHVVPFGTLAWSVDADGKPSFIVRTLQDSLEWRRCDRELTPVATRHLRGIPNPQKGQHLAPLFSGALYIPNIESLELASLGADRWWVAQPDQFSSKPWHIEPTIFDARDGTLQSLAELDGWPVPVNGIEIERVLGDGIGGCVVEARDRHRAGRKDFILRIDERGQVLWSARNPGVLNQSLELELLTSTGEVLVRLVRESRFAVFDSDGDLVRHIELVDPEWREGLQIEQTQPLDSDHLLVVWLDDQDRRVARVLDVATGELTATYWGAELSPFGELKELTLQADGGLWRREGRQLVRVAFGANAGDAMKGAIVERIADPALDLHVADLHTVQILPDGRFAAHDADTGRLHVWDADGRVSFHAPAPRGGMGQARFAVDHEGALWLFDTALGRGEDTAALGWSRTGEPLGKLFTAGVPAFDPNGERIWICDRDLEAIRWERNVGLQLYDKNGDLLRETRYFAYKDHEVKRVEVSRLSVAADGTAYIWGNGSYGSVAFRFDESGQIGSWTLGDKWTTWGPAAQHDMRALGMLSSSDSFSSRASRPVLMELGEGGTLQYASLAGLAPAGWTNMGFSPDGTEVWFVVGDHASIAKRSLEGLEWESQ